MKLKKEFITHMIAGSHVTVPVGKAARSFHGLVKSNETAAFIIEHLKADTTEEAVADAMLEEYDVSREKALEDVRKVVRSLGEIGALE